MSPALSPCRVTRRSWSEESCEVEAVDSERGNCQLCLESSGASPRTFCMNCTHTSSKTWKERCRHELQGSQNLNTIIDKFSSMVNNSSSSSSGRGRCAVLLQSIVAAVLFFSMFSCSSAQSFDTPPTSCSDLHRRYNYIFRHGNRNSASHLWSAHLLDLAGKMDADEFVELNRCFCAVSGSPVRPSDYNRYGLLLDAVAPADADASSTCPAQNVFAFMHYCCWPCVCDTLDYIKGGSCLCPSYRLRLVLLSNSLYTHYSPSVDTKTVTFKSGESKKLHFAVIGDPCKGPGVESENDLLGLDVPDSFGHRRGMPR